MFNKNYYDNISVKGQRVKLEKFKISELNANFINNLNNKGLFKFSRHKNVRHTYITSYNYIKNLPKESLYLSIKLRKSNKIIGSITVYFKKNFLFADVGILINSRNHLGMGYGEEAWINIINYLEKKIKIRYITGGCKVNNIRMIKLFKSSNMSQTIRNINDKIFFIKKK